MSFLSEALVTERRRSIDGQVETSVMKCVKPCALNNEESDYECDTDAGMERGRCCCSVSR